MYNQVKLYAAIKLYYVEVHLIVVRLLPVILSLLLLGAHYYRAGFIFLVVIMGGSVMLLLVRQPWVVRVIQVLLLLGAMEWLRTVISLVMARQSMGMPWVRLAFILGGVALLSFFSIFILFSRPVRRHYRCE